MQLDLQIYATSKTQEGGHKMTALSGGGGLAWFGSVFYLPLMLMSTKYLAGDTKPGFELFFACLFACIATCLVFGREGKELDLDRDTFTNWKGTKYWRIWKTERELKDFNQVRVEKETRSSQDSSYTVYAIYLDKPGEEQSWSEPGEYLEARRTCEALSRFLGLPFDDKITGHRREPDQLDLSIFERMQLDGEEMPSRPTRPEVDNINFTESGVATKFEFPQSINWVELFVLLLLPFMFGGCLSDEVAANSIGWENLKLIFGALLILAVGAVCMKLSRLFRVPMVVSISKEGLRYGEKGKLKAAKLIPLDKIEELDLLPGKTSWVARSDDVIVEVEGKLSLEEVNWMFEETRYQVLKLSGQLG